MRVFIVGATGILGRHLLPLLLREGYEVRALVRTMEKAEALQRAGIEVELGDLLATEVMFERLPQMMHGCDAVLHIATAIPADPSQPEAWLTTGDLRIKGTPPLLFAAQQAGVTSYIQQSIVMAYADGGERWLDEAEPFDRSPERSLIVGPVKIMEELVRKTTQMNFRWCILRGGNFVGHGTQQDGLVEKVRTDQAMINGDGSNYQSFVHVADMAAAILAAIRHAPTGSTFNIAAEPIHYGTYLDHIADLFHAPHPLRQIERASPPSYRASSTLAREILGWEAKHDIYEDVVPLAAR